MACEEEMFSYGKTAKTKKELIEKALAAYIAEQKMPEIIQHTINYTLEELKKMVKPSTYEYVTIFDGLPVHQIKDVNCLSGEVFRKYPKNNAIEVSNLGRMKINNEIVEQWDDDANGKGWLYVKIKTIAYPKYVYRFVAETWCQCPDDTQGWEVHHISNNGYDNRPDNLIWIKREAHGKIPTIFHP
jgi:hypothetical protein